MKLFVSLLAMLALFVAVAPAADAKPYTSCKAGPELKGKLRIRGNVTCSKARYVVCGWYFLRGTDKSPPLHFECRGLTHTRCFRTGGAIRFDGELLEC